MTAAVDVGLAHGGILPARLGAGARAAIGVPQAPLGDAWPPPALKVTHPTWLALAALLDDPVQASDTAAIAACVADYHREALHINAARGKKSGHQLRRVVYLLSSNPHKTAEYAVLFDRYGIEVLRAPVSDNPLYLQALLQLASKGLQVLSVHREQNTLYDIATQARLLAAGDFSAPRAVMNVSTLVVYTRLDGRVVGHTYTASRNGMLTPVKRSRDPSVFGWDDVFVPTGLTGHPSFFELRQRGYKVSPRDMVVGQYIAQSVHYGQTKDFKFTPVRPRSAIDFACSVAEHVDTVPHYNTPLVRAYGLRGMLNAVLNGGMHWRAAKNRREGTYWYPGLNAGIPVTQKSDAFHQETYLFHDFGHFMIRDLIFTGCDSPLHRHAYILYRMMSEAMTMVTTDMLFVDAVKRGGFVYDYGKRLIYPLFEATGLSFADPAQRWNTLRQLLRANVAYCVRGDDASWRALLAGSVDANPSSMAALEAFKRKYEPFFVEDYRWTDHNYAKMVEHAGEVRDWWQHVSTLQSLADVSFTTIDGFLTRLRPHDGDLADQVCEAILRDCVAPMLAPAEPPVLAPPEVRLRAAFVRYMAGQLGILSRFDRLICETPLYRQRIMHALTEALPHLDLDAIQAVRAIYEEYLTLLIHRGMITSDDFETYREVYPLFDPLYVSYDRDGASYQPLSAVARGILPVLSY